MRKIILPIEDTRHKVAFELIKQTPQKEVVKVLTENSDIGVSAEYEWVRFRWAESESWEKYQRLTECKVNGKKVMCDILTYTGDNGVIKEFIFDISSFFGKEKGKQEKYTGPEYLNAAVVTKKFDSLISRYEEKNEDGDISEKEYMAHIEEYIEKDKLRHIEYLAKLKKFAEKYPEILNFQVKYANELVTAINDHDTFKEAKDHLRQIKKLIKNYSYNEKLIANYGHALLFFANYFHRVDPIDMDSMEQTIEKIYTLWKGYPTVYELLDIYSYGLHTLFTWSKSQKEKKRFMSILKNIIKINPSYASVKNYISLFFDLFELIDKDTKKKYIVELQKFINKYPLSLLAGSRIYDYILDKNKLIVALMDIQYQQPRSSLLQGQIIDALADFFQDGQNRDVLKNMSIEYVFNLTNYRLSFNLNADCYTIINSYISVNTGNIEMACRFAEALAWDIVAVSNHGYDQKFTDKSLKFLCGNLKILSEKFPDIPIIVEKYAEALIDCHDTYNSKKGKIECKKAFAVLAKKYPDNVVIKDIEERMNNGETK